MKYQQICIATLLFSFVFFAPAGFSAWTTACGTTSSDSYRVIQQLGGDQDYTLNFADENDLVVHPVNSDQVSLPSATASLLHLGFQAHYPGFSQSSPSPHTFIIAMIGTFAGGVGYLNHLLSQNPGGSLTINQLNLLTLTGLSFNTDMHIEIKLADSNHGKSVKICSRTGKAYSDGTPKTILVTVTYNSVDTTITLEFEVSVPGTQQLVDFSLLNEKDSDSINRDDEDDPDDGCCGSLSGGVSAAIGCVISFCCGETGSSETQPFSSSKDSYNSLQLKMQVLAPQVEINSPLKMAVEANALLQASVISAY